MKKQGRILALNGVHAWVKVDFPVQIYEAVEVSDHLLLGEVVQIEDKKVEVLLYELSAPLRVDDLVTFSGYLMKGINAQPGKIYNATGRRTQYFSEFSFNYKDAFSDDGAYLRHRKKVLAPIASSSKILTGVRGWDIAYPLFLGESAALYGSSGTGKTTLLHMLARNTDSDFVVYVSCFSRGGEVLDFIETLSPSQAARTVFFVHSASDVPEAAEIAILQAVASAERYRELGKNVLLLIDEMPEDERTRIKLCSHLSACIGLQGNETKGSVTLVLASKDFLPGAYKTELRLTHADFFPSIDYTSSLSSFFCEEAEEEMRKYFLEILSNHRGIDAWGCSVPLREWYLLRRELLELFFIKQDLYSHNAFSSWKHTLGLLGCFKKLDSEIIRSLEAGVSIADILHLSLHRRLIELRNDSLWDFDKISDQWLSSLVQQISIISQKTEAISVAEAQPHNTPEGIITGKTSTRKRGKEQHHEAL